MFYMKIPWNTIWCSPFWLACRSPCDHCGHSSVGSQDTLLFQHVLLSLEIRMVETHPGPALHTDGVHPVHETTVLEVFTVSKHLQPLACEALPLVEHYLGEDAVTIRGKTEILIQLQSPVVKQKLHEITAWDSFITVNTFHLVKFLTPSWHSTSRAYGANVSLFGQLH